MTKISIKQNDTIPCEMKQWKPALEEEEGWKKIAIAAALESSLRAEQ